MKYITFSGGYYNVEPIRLSVTEAQYDLIAEGFYPLDEILSADDMKRLNKHFRMDKDCLCGGVNLATITF